MPLLRSSKRKVAPVSSIDIGETKRNNHARSDEDHCSHKPSKYAKHYDNDSSSKKEKEKENKIFDIIVSLTPSKNQSSKIDTDIRSLHAENPSLASNGSDTFIVSEGYRILLSGYLYLPHLFYPKKVLNEEDIIPLFHLSMMSSSNAKEIVRLWNHNKIGVCYHCASVCETEKFYSIDHLPICQLCRQSNRDFRGQLTDSLLNGEVKFDIHRHLDKRVGWCNQCSSVAIGFSDNGCEIVCFKCELYAMRISGPCSGPDSMYKSNCHVSSNFHCHFCYLTRGQHSDTKCADDYRKTQLRAKLMRIVDETTKAEICMNENVSDEQLSISIISHLHDDWMIAPLMTVDRIYTTTVDVPSPSLSCSPTLTPPFSFQSK